MSAAAPSHSEHFYRNLPLVTDFAGVTRPENFSPLPDDWHIALCDVRGSTRAVEAGHYKNVSTLGAAAITAVVNAVGDCDVPFSFEGDGSVIAVPARFLDAVRSALALTREIARDAFDLDLRIATVPVAHLHASGYRALVARYRVSEHYTQAVFSGGGVAYAETLMKAPATAQRYLIAPGSVPPTGSHAGLECRWQDIPSRHGETVSLMIRATGDPLHAAATYQAVIAKVHEIYGGDERSHPVHVPALQMTFSAPRLHNEVAFRAEPGKVALWKTRAMVLLGRLLMRFGLRTRRTDWSRYKTDLARNTDVRKFVDVYRHILAGTEEQRLALTAWLDERYADGALVYGLHVSDRAHLTCLVFDYSGRHMHFIDGADGGLFLAAKAFKERAARLQQSVPA